MATNRDRKRVGRGVTYFPDDTEAATGNGTVGDAWAAKITNRNVDGTVNLLVCEADGGIIAKTSVTRRDGVKGFYGGRGGQAFI